MVCVWPVTEGARALGPAGKPVLLDSRIVGPTLPHPGLPAPGAVLHLSRAADQVPQHHRDGHWPNAARGGAGQAVGAVPGECRGTAPGPAVLCGAWYWLLSDQQPDSTGKVARRVRIRCARSA